MGRQNPFKSTFRPYVGSEYNFYAARHYIKHSGYANDPVHYVRAFLLLLKDLIDLFDYIEPSDKNLTTYSYRIHSLLARSCIEVEANLKSILKQNSYKKKTNLTMDGDYARVNVTHKLSSYAIMIPNWRGSAGERTPFREWGLGNSLSWYQSYNKSKHDRHMQFEKADFQSTVDACCGVLVLLSAQFCTYDFSWSPEALTIADGVNEWHTGIGEFFQVRFPDDWTDEECYEKSWDKQIGVFDEHDYSSIDSPIARQLRVCRHCGGEI